MLRPQHFYNIFTINHRWLFVIGSNLNLIPRLPFHPNNNNLLVRIYCKNVVNFFFLINKKEVYSRTTSWKHKAEQRLQRKKQTEKRNETQKQTENSKELVYTFLLLYPSQFFRFCLPNWFLISDFLSVLSFSPVSVYHISLADSGRLIIKKDCLKVRGT